MAVNAPPKGVKARLQQAVATAAAATSSEPQLTVANAADSVKPIAQSEAVTISEPNLARSASPTLPYDSAELRTSPAAFDTAPPYDSTDMSAVSALDMQRLQFTDFEPGVADSSGRDESAAELNVFAAPSAAAAEDAAALVPIVYTKPTQGNTATSCFCKAGPASAALVLLCTSCRILGNIIWSVCTSCGLMQSVVFSPVKTDDSCKHVA